MSKTKTNKTKNGYTLENENIDINDHEYPTAIVEDTLYYDMGVYGYNINLQRSFPNVRDGLKPVQRVIAYTGFKHGFRANKPYKKSLRYIGAGSTYYVHGDASFYGTLMTMAQDFYSKYPLIDVHGNCGSITGDEPASQRYTESRLSQFTEDLLQDFTKESVDWEDNYDNTEEQPTVLPVAYPYVLLGGNYGIGEAYIGSIPSHNFKDIIDRTIMLINNPDIDEDELIGDLTPDYPTGGIIINKQDLKLIYKTGNDPKRLAKYGKTEPQPIRIRAKIEVTKGDNLLITQIPFMRNIGSVLDSIQNAVKSGKVEGISGVKDHSNATVGVKIELLIKRGYDPRVVEAALYKATILQVSITTHFTCTTSDRLSYKYYNFKEMLEEWIAFRKSSLLRNFNSKISKINRKIHIDEGLLKALDPKLLDKIIKMIRASKNSDEVYKHLMNDYGFTNIQARYIADLKLVQLCNMEIAKIEEDLKIQKKFLAEYEEYFTKPKKLNKYIIDCLEDGVKKYNNPRLTEAIELPTERPEEYFVENTTHTILCTKLGYVKKVEGDRFKLQNAKGLGIQCGKLKEGDTIHTIFTADNKDDVLIFTNLGRVMPLKVYEIRDTALSNLGVLLSSYLEFKPNEKPIHMMVRPKDMTQGYMIFATRNGLIKKTKAELYKSITRYGISALSLNDDDIVVKILYIEDDLDIVVTTANGHVSRYSTEDIPTTLRMAKGVRSINVKDIVVSCDCYQDEESSYLVLTNQGKGKRVDMEFLPKKPRDTKPEVIAKLTKDEYIVSTIFVHEDDELTVVGSKTIVKIPVNQIPTMLKNNSCKEIVKLAKEEEIITCNI